MKKFILKKFKKEEIKKEDDEFYELEKTYTSEYQEYEQDKYWLIK
mgnify:CR=1 FL=1